MKTMADVFTTQKRSEIMSHVRSRGGKATELAMVSLLRRHGITGWRRGARIFGNPDFVFPKHQIALFVDGCFWHGCPRHASQPATHRIFWKQKLTRNRARDRLVTRRLKKQGWIVVRVWQHDLRRNKPLCVNRILSALSTRRRSDGAPKRTRRGSES